MRPSIWRAQDAGCGLAAPTSAPRLTSIGAIAVAFARNCRPRETKLDSRTRLRFLWLMEAGCCDASIHAAWAGRDHQDGQFDLSRSRAGASPANETTPRMTLSLSSTSIATSGADCHGPVTSAVASLG